MLPTLSYLITVLEALVSPFRDDEASLRDTESLVHAVSKCWDRDSNPCSWGAGGNLPPPPPRRVIQINHSENMP